MAEDQNPSLSGRVRIRGGDSSDVGAVLGFFDGAVRWLARQGRTGQWGDRPFSEQPRRIELVRGWAVGGGLWIAEIDAVPVGAIALGEAPAHIPPAPEPELYIQGLVTDREYRGQGVGAALLTHARAEAARRGVNLLRMDCWAGGDQALVRYYERAGFTSAGRLTVGDWEGQILYQRC